MNSAFNSTMDKARPLSLSADDMRELRQFAKTYQRRLDRLERAHGEGSKKDVKYFTNDILTSFGAKVCMAVCSIKLQPGEIPPTFAPRSRNAPTSLILFTRCRSLRWCVWNPRPLAGIGQ